MVEIFWTVAKDGKFLFRTDVGMNAGPEQAKRIEAELIAAFPAAQNYHIERSERASAWRSYEVGGGVVKLGGVR